MTATETDLQKIADFDHPFRVTADGDLTDDGLSGIYAPDVFHSPHDDIEIYDNNWTALKGFTGQYSYNGAVMHSSEYIGGGLADHILATPGIYCVVVVNVHPEDAEPGEDTEDMEPAGWAVLRYVEQCPGCDNPVSPQERLTGRCAKDGQPLNFDRATVVLSSAPTTTNRGNQS